MEIETGDVERVAVVNEAWGVLAPAKGTGQGLAGANGNAITDWCDGAIGQQDIAEGLLRVNMRRNGSREKDYAGDQLFASWHFHWKNIGIRVSRHVYLPRRWSNTVKLPAANNAKGTGSGTGVTVAWKIIFGGIPSNAKVPPSVITGLSRHWL